MTRCLAALGRFVGDPAYSNLPRKYKTAVSGCTQHCTVHEINDIAFVGFGRKVRGLKVAANRLPGYLEQLLRRYEATRDPDETFAGWVRRVDDDQLAQGAT